MLIKLPTAEEVRSQVKIEMMNQSLRTIHILIKIGIKENRHGIVFYNMKYGETIRSIPDTDSVIPILKEHGYIIKQCPVEGNEGVYFLQWEESYVEDRNDLTIPDNWGII